MPTVVWQYPNAGAPTATLTWDKGMQEVAAEDYESTVLSERLGGGEVAAYDLGIGPLKTRHFLFQGVTVAKLAEFITWRDTTVNFTLNKFTHTDNTQGTPEVLIGRIVRCSWRRMRHVTSTPTYEVSVDFQVEP